MEFVVIFLVTLVVAYIILRKTNHKLKSEHQKKSEIIEQYENELKILLQNNQNKTEVKTEFLKKCNDELSRNIFFTKEESSQLLQRLAQL